MCGPGGSCGAAGLLGGSIMVTQHRQLRFERPLSPVCARGVRTMAGGHLLVGHIPDSGVRYTGLGCPCGRSSSRIPAAAGIVLHARWMVASQVSRG